jgi:uncharacterized protein (TIGR03435 family)
VIVDQTGLQGEFDFALRVVPDESLPNPMDTTVIMRAMREDVGLVIDAKNEAMEYWVIDGVERASAN